jgi:hypothetical protein
VPRAESVNQNIVADDGGAAPNGVARPSDVCPKVDEHVKKVMNAVEVTRHVRMSSFPAWAERSMVSGPWSMDWLNHHNHGDAGVIFSSKKIKNLRNVIDNQKQNGVSSAKRRKVGGTLRHSVHTLKKVALLPSKDRSAMLHDLKKIVRKRQGSDRVHRAVEAVPKGDSDEASSSDFVNND